MINKKNHRCHSLTNGLAHTCHSLMNGVTHTCHSLTSEVASICHSLTSDSEEIRNLNQMPYLAHAQGMTGESGRSMVEMLGVLAIIGVLSVGGIAGYKMAMTKHKANELLNEASKRAVVVAAKIAAGQFNASTALNEFGSEKVQGVSFTSSYTNGATTFDLTLTWDANSNKDSVCNQMKNIAGENGVPKIETNCDKITYNVDLSVGAEEPIIEPDDNMIGCTKENTGYDGNEEYNGDFTNQFAFDTWRCQCSSEYPIWDGSNCVSYSTLETECTDNNKCASGEYCLFSIPENTSLTSTSPGIGKCVKLSGIKKTTNGQFYYGTSRSMDWFSAKNWCEALPGNHKLVKVKTALASPYNCDYATYSCPDFCGAFKAIGLTDGYWTNGCDGIPSGCDASIAWVIAVSHGGVGDYEKSSTGFPLCE